MQSLPVPLKPPDSLFLRSKKTLSHQQTCSKQCSLSHISYLSLRAMLLVIHVTARQREPMLRVHTGNLTPLFKHIAIYITV